MHYSERILIVGPAWVGDMVMTQALFQLLCQSHPVEIDVLAPATTYPLLSRMPEVHNGIIASFSGGQLALARRYQLAKTLRNRHYQKAIIIPNSFKSALVPYWARIPQRIGWLGEQRYVLLNDWRRLNKKKYPAMLQRLLALGMQPNTSIPQEFRPKLSVTLEQRNHTLQSLNVSLPNQPVLILCPGAEYGPAKRWPPSYFAEIANFYIQQNWQVWILGAKKEIALARQIMLLTGNQCLNLVGKTQLTQAVDLLSLANLVVSNDSGLMHIAAALDRRLVVLYGSSSRTFTPPLSEQVIPLSLDLACSPCFKRECQFKHYHCLTQLLPNTVFNAIAQRGW